MIRIAKESDLPAVAAVYEAILDLSLIHILSALRAP